MNKIQKLSRFFKKIFWIIFLGWPICLVWIWFGDQQHGLFAELGFNIKSFIPNNSLPILVSLSLATKWQGFLLSCIPVGINMFILYLFTRLFTCYEQGQIFVINSIRYLKKIGIWMFIGAAINPLYQLAMSLVLTIHNPPGHRELALGFGSEYFRNLIIAGLVFLVAYIMQEALKLQEEQQLTI